MSVAAPASEMSLYGGSRLQPDHFEPDRVPIEVARHGTAAKTLRVGTPGKVGVLELDFALRGEPGSERTELVHHYQKTPLQIMRPLYYDDAWPQMPFTYLLTAGNIQPIFGVASFVMAVVMTFFEILVIVLQAYVFTVLTATYLNGAVEPAH